MFLSKMNFGWRCVFVVFPFRSRIFDNETNPRSYIVEETQIWIDWSEWLCNRLVRLFDYHLLAFLLSTNLKHNIIKAYFTCPIEDNNNILYQLNFVSMTFISDITQYNQVSLMQDISYSCICDSQCLTMLRDINIK